MEYLYDKAEEILNRRHVSHFEKVSYTTLGHPMVNSTQIACLTSTPLNSTLTFDNEESQTEKWYETKNFFLILYEYLI